jgi:hypothetical protein
MLTATSSARSNCEDQFEAVAVPQRSDLVALAAITGLPAPDSSSAERDSLHGLADAFPFLTVHHLEHYPTADHQVGERPGCTVVLHGHAPSEIDGATALVRLFGLRAGRFHRLVPVRKLPSIRRRTHGWLGGSRQVSDW